MTPERRQPAPHCPTIDGEGWSLSCPVPTHTDTWCAITTCGCSLDVDEDAPCPHQPDGMHRQLLFPGEHMGVDAGCWLMESPDTSAAVFQPSCASQTLTVR